MRVDVHWIAGMGPLVIEVDVVKVRTQVLKLVHCDEFKHWSRDHLRVGLNDLCDFFFWQITTSTTNTSTAISATSTRRAVLPSMIATHEFIVPKSIPTTEPLTLEVFFFFFFIIINSHYHDYPHKSSSTRPTTKKGRPPSPHVNHPHLCTKRALITIMGPKDAASFGP